MSEVAERLKNELAKLPQSERAEILEFLAQSLDEEDDEFDVELKRRVAEIEAGTAKGIPAEEVFEKMRRKYP